MKTRKRFWIGYKVKRDFSTLFLEFSEKYPEVLSESGTQIYISTMETYFKMVEKSLEDNEADTDFYKRYKNIKKDYEDLMEAEF